MEIVFRALADATRLRILGLLLTGEVCVCHIHQSLEISQPKASRHLAYLRRAHLVETRRRGLWVYYRLAPLPDPVLATVHRAVTHALGHLDRIRKDVGRLSRFTGRCLPAVDGSESRDCCGDRGHTSHTDTSTDVSAAARVRLTPLPPIEAARAADGPAILRLLQENSLPVDGILDHLKSGLVARADGRVVGSAALEFYPEGAVLRSVAVDRALRSRGLGHDLTERALTLAASQGVSAVYLLTTTAERFFPKFGFTRIARDDVPASVRESVEFRSACPVSAVVMWKRL